MHGVVRRYRGASALNDALASRSQEVRAIIGGVPGFVAYYALRTGEGVATITVCEDKTGTDESVRVAAGWVRENLPAGAVSAPEITEGETYMDFTK